MNITNERIAQLDKQFADATLDNALDAIEWLVYVQDFAKLDKTIEETIVALREICQIENDYVVEPQEFKPFERIFSLFAKAKESGLDWPRIKLGTDLQITLAINAKGVINITNGERYGTPSNIWYGRITHGFLEQDANRLTLRESVRDEDKDTVQNCIKNFDLDPTNTAKLFGDRTGTCMFCQRHLTHPESVVAGYGATCAGNFGLPYGVEK